MLLCKTRSLLWSYFAPILEYKDFDELLDSFKNKEKPLAAYLYSENSKEQNKFLNGLSAGGVCINDCLTHVANHSTTIWWGR